MALGLRRSKGADSHGSAVAGSITLPFELTTATAPTCTASGSMTSRERWRPWCSLFRHRPAVRGAGTGSCADRSPRTLANPGRGDRSTTELGVGATIEVTGTTEIEDHRSRNDGDDTLRMIGRTDRESQ